MSQARRKFETVCTARAVIAAPRVAEYNFAPLRAGRVLSEFRSEFWSGCRSSIRREMHIGGWGMASRQKSACVRLWLAVIAMVLAGLGGGRSFAATLARGTEDPTSADSQDKDKKVPLKPDRKIEFTTDEGTWLSLDVSPDGKTIVFELLGNLYTLPIEGGDARLISGGMAFDSQPRFSPDGKWIAFISDRDGSENIWMIHPDGSE